MAVISRLVTPDAFKRPITATDFDLGSPKVLDFVKVDNVRAHLKVMTAMHKLHLAVNADGVQVNKKTNLPIASPAQMAFLVKAVKRFDLWLHNIVKTPERSAGQKVPLTVQELPPLDVLMVLHAYMLSPWNFFEDCYRHFHFLDNIVSFPVEKAGNLIDNGYTYTGLPEQVAHWESRTAEPFVAPLPVTSEDNITVDCPHCTTPNKVSVVSGKSDDSVKPMTGFAESKFTASCSTCFADFSKDTICVARFLGDIKHASEGEGTIAHNLLTPQGTIDLGASKSIVESLAPALKGMPVNQMSLQDVKDLLLEKLGKTPQWKYRIENTISAYKQTGEYSLDLEGAVLRQGRYLQHMIDVHWCCIDCPDPFEGNYKLLSTAVDRYTRFLSLDPCGIVPPPDIDIVFHTHQLMGSVFRDQIHELLGRYLNHDDTPPLTSIGESLKRGEEIWTNHFQDKYEPDYTKYPAPCPYPRKPKPATPPTSLPCTNGCSVTGGSTVYYEGFE